MINEYVKVGRIREACELFDEMSERNEVSYTIVISECVGVSEFEEAWRWFVDVRRRGVMSNQKMFLVVLSVVIGLDNVVTLADLVTMDMKMGYSEDVVVGTAILNAFTRVGNFDMALRRLELTAGDRKLYFVGHGELDDDDDLFYPLEIKFYDIPKRKWMDNIPKLKAPMLYSLVFFIDHRLYVFSCDDPHGGQPHFDMMNMNHLSKGWVALPQPNSFWKPAGAFELGTLIIDHHSNEITSLYVKPCGGCCMHAFSFKDQTWCNYTNEKSLTPLRCHLLSIYRWNNCVIKENHLYTF
ncbi:hypothetical protein P3L10_010814 [Capsicum annuum]